MTVHLDTSALVDSLTGSRRSIDRLIELTHQSHRLAISSIVLYEWLRGPRTRPELLAQEELFPRESVRTFGPGDAATAARLYREITNARGREIDLAIAACAMTDGAALWTLNRRDFSDVPNLRVL